MDYFTYPSVWPLPYGVVIRNDHSKEFNYAIERSQTQCWPIQLGGFEQVTIVGMHNGWIGHQAWVLRAWLSVDPNGMNILPAFFGTRRNVHLSYFGNSWNFYIVDLPECEREHANTNYWIYRDQPYYFNVQNTSNINDGYYLRFLYKGKCVEPLVI